MRVLAFRTDTCGVSWHRMRLPLGELVRQNAIELASTPDLLPLKLFARGPEESEQEMMRNSQKVYNALAKGAHVIHTQRSATYELFGAFKALSLSNGVPWIIDVDDDIVSLDKENPAYEVYRERDVDECYDQREIKSRDEVGEDEIGMVSKVDGKMYAVVQKRVDMRELSIAQLRQCDAIFTTTTNLRCLYENMRAKHNRVPGSVYILPNSIDIEFWDSVPRPSPHPGEVWIGWAGSTSHWGDMSLIVPVMRDVLLAHRNVRFFWLKMPHRGLQMLHEEFGDRAQMYEGWSSPEDWTDYYVSLNFDISLGPLQDTQFNRCKSNLKWLEAGVMRQPFVCSDVGPYSDSIAHGRDGFRCKRASQWTRAVNALVESKQLRDDVGGAAREVVESRYSLTANCHMWKAAYEDVLKRQGDSCMARAKEILGAVQAGG